MSAPSTNERFKTAVEQMNAAIETYLYPKGETLRADISPLMRNKLEEFLGHPLEECAKEQILQQARFMAKHMDDFFQDLSRAVLATGGTIPFYSDIDNRMAITRPQPRLKPVNYAGLAIGMHGETPDPRRVIQIARSHPDLAESHANLLANLTARYAAEARQAGKHETGELSPMEQAWQENGERALERANDPSHTRAALEAITRGEANQFHRDTTPEGIRAAQAAQAEQRLNR